jgi:hypothetical protein
MKAAGLDPIHTPKSEEDQDLERGRNMLEVLYWSRLSPRGNENLEK